MAERGFISGFEKTADAVAIPEGGLKAGAWMNDLTQVMTAKDAKLVREKLPFYHRSGPGLAVSTLLGGSVGRMWGLPGAAVGSALGGLLPYYLMRSGKYDKQALEAAKAAIEKAKGAK
jgi:hypothetical protein